MLLGAACRWPHAARAAARPPDGDAARPGSSRAAARPPRPRPFRRLADRYTHIDNEMIEDMLACLTRRWQAAVMARARIDHARGAEPRSAVAALDEWLALFREHAGEIQLPFALPLAQNRGAQ